MTFVQHIQGTVADAAGLRLQWDRWLAEQAHAAAGWLGATGGITPSGEFVVAARFQSLAAARDNSARSAQGKWWTATAACLEGPATFVESDDVTVVWGGGSDAAGFVQLMHARVSDRSRLLAIESAIEDEFRRYRPDVIGGYRFWHGDGRMTAVDYFTSEAEARAGESREPPPELAGSFQEWFSLLEDATYLDLPDPWLASPLSGG